MLVISKTEQLIQIMTQARNIAFVYRTHCIDTSLEVLIQTGVAMLQYQARIKPEILSIQARTRPSKPGPTYEFDPMNK